MKLCAYAIECIEYERGWGSRSDGYYLFSSESLADTFIARRYAGRDMGSVPAYYEKYNKVGWVPISDKTAQKIKESNGRHFVGRLE